MTEMLSLWGGFIFLKKGIKKYIYCIYKAFCFQTRF